MDIFGLISTTTAISEQIYQLTSRWSFAPEELHRLRDTLTGFYGLWQNAQRTWDVTTKAPGNVVIALSDDISQSMRLLTGLSHAIYFINTGTTPTLTSHDSPSVSVKILNSRWCRKEREIIELHKTFRVIYFRCLNELVRLNSSVLADQVVSSNELPLVASNFEQLRQTSSFGYHYDQSIPADIISTHDAQPTTEHGHKPLLYTHSTQGSSASSHQPNHSDLHSMDPEPKMLRNEGHRILRDLHEPKMLQRRENKTLPRESPKTLQTHFETELLSVQRRNSLSENDFKRLEKVLSLFMAQNSALSAHLPPVHPSHATSRTRAAADNNKPTRQPPAGALGKSTIPSGGIIMTTCHCKCHMEKKRRIAKWRLTAFKSTLGAITFEFRGGGGGRQNQSCPTCESTCTEYLRTTRSVRLMYTFPAWLFHAAVSATYSDTYGSPELLLRVLRRLPSSDAKTVYTSIFGYIARGDGENLKRALRRKEVSVFDIRSDSGAGVLSSAVTMAKFDLIEILLYEGADLFQTDDWGNAPYTSILNVLYATTQLSPHFKTKLEALLPLESMIESAQLTGLHQIVMGIKHSSVADYLRDADPVRHQEANAYDVRYCTPLAYASARGDVAVVRDLLRVGALPDLPVPSSRHEPRTPLMFASWNGHLDVVRELLAAGADVDATNSMGHRAMHQIDNFLGGGGGGGAVGVTKIPGKDVEIADCLLHYGADIMAEDKWLSTPLDLACLYNQTDLVRFLLRNGADPNHRDWEGTTALGTCVVGNAYDAAAILLEDDHHYQKQQKQQKQKQKQHGASYLSVDENGQGILHYLGMCGSLPLIELFTSHRMRGLDVDALDREGRTARDLYRSRSDVTVELDAAFHALLESVSRTISPGQVDDDKVESDEFFDAVEWPGLSDV